MIYKFLKFVVKILTVITAIVFTVYKGLSSELTTQEGVIIALLCLIALSAVLEDLDSDRKWGQIRKDLSSEISSVSQCRIKVFSSPSDWVSAIHNLSSEGTHSQDSASLDSTTRSKALKDHKAIWTYVNECCANKNTTFRHIVRIRNNNLENLFDRILSGNANKNSFFRYYNLEPNFSFPTFGIIDNKYVATRSPYQEGALPQYLIIENELLVDYYQKYFDNLWVNAAIIDISVLDKFYNRFKSSYNANIQKRMEKKLETIRKKGIKNDI